MRLAPVSLLATIPFFATQAQAWGFAGHSIVATIAEIHLHPEVLSFLQSPESNLLPSYAHGHLAPIASWPDRIRMVPEYRGWSGQLHYASVVGDHPPQVCDWPVDDGRHEIPVGAVARSQQEHGKGEGWKDENDVLHAIANYTTRLERNSQDWESLRFLVHFLGDAHQPMHLTNRERGGNGDPIRWEGRRANLHGLWDNLLLSRKLREQTNYTRPLPSRQIESALTGAIYDPLIRLLLWEGVRVWWRDLIPSWLSCPSQPSRLSSLAGKQTVLSAVPLIETASLNEIVCPVHWASGTHKVTCALAFPSNYDEHANPPVEVGGNTPYYRAIADSLTIERLLVQAGLRLAATLNTVLAEPARSHVLARDGQDQGQGTGSGPLNLDWMLQQD
ncbi:S1/P1 nuclease [Sporobolomyces koalae]|uniref:S1/P1 nuclease n=1 Tax=Sporobolomyces koalae TaxID=500713 RepID=UPI00317B209B